MLVKDLKVDDRLIKDLNAENDQLDATEYFLNRLYDELSNSEEFYFANKRNNIDIVDFDFSKETIIFCLDNLIEVEHSIESENDSENPPALEIIKIAEFIKKTI